MFKICSLFAGVGGIDLGFLQTNECEIAYANEFDKYAVETYEKNFKNAAKPYFMRVSGSCSIF